MVSDGAIDTDVMTKLSHPSCAMKNCGKTPSNVESQVDGERNVVSDGGIQFVVVMMRLSQPD